MSVSEVCRRSMREVAEMAAQYYTSVAGASNHINNNIINMKVTSNLKSYSSFSSKEAALNVHNSVILAVLNKTELNHDPSYPLTFA